MTTRPDPTVERLSDVVLFSGLAPEEIRALLDGGERKEVPSGETIFREGDPVTGLYVIESGKVAVRRATADGKHHDLAVLAEKHVFGEMGLIVGGRPRRATVATLEACVLWHFPTEAFMRLIERGSPAASKVLLSISRVLANRLDGLNDAIVKLVETSASQKKVPEKKVAELAAFKDKLYREWSF